jgi:hypothetical protein
MNVASSAASAQRQKVLLPILVGGGVAGTLDLILAFNSYGRGMPRGIASGLLGQRAFDGGLATWILGIFLHFFIAFSAAAIYCLTSRKLKFLKDHFFVCGLFYGIACFLVMNLIVLPLSALPHKSSTFTRTGLIHGLLVQMLIIGLPISFSARKFLK